MYVTPGSCVANSQGVCTVTFVWDASNVANQSTNVEVKAKDAGTAQEALYVSGLRGSASAPWIKPQGTDFYLYLNGVKYDELHVQALTNATGYNFLPTKFLTGFQYLLAKITTIKNNLFNQSEVFAQDSGTGSLITAAPNPCILGADGLCTSTISLHAGGYTDVHVIVRETGGFFITVGASPTGSWDAPWITAQGYHLDLYSGSNLIDSVFVSGVARTDNSLIAASPNPCILGTNGLCSSTISLNASQYPNLQVKLKETGTPFTGAGANPNDSWAAPWITEAGYTFELYSNSTLISSLLVKGVSTVASASPTSSPIASASVSPSPSASSSPAASPVTPVNTVSYKVAETETGLQNAPLLPYSAHPTVTDFTFSDTTPGSKQIWAEFIGSDGTSRTEHITVELLEPDPVLTSLDCSMDISKQDLKLTLNGSRLGSSSGKVTADTKDAQILSWGNNQVTAIIKPEGVLEDGRVFKVVLTRNDSKILPEITCQVNTTLISLGARLICREPGKFDTKGVKVALVDENGNKVNEEVTIDNDGIIKGLKTKLQVGKTYAISVKAPFSLRRNALFTAANGTNMVTPEDGSIFILPIGDIAPVILNDGKINTPDHAEIIRQWSVFGTTVKTADFNKDSRVNSIDWACMRYDFNKEDEEVPVTAALPTPLPSPSLVPGPSSQASSSPEASVQRAAYFLINPFGGGSYKKDDEFIVNINIWSQKEAANLFVAKMSFDPSALEVVRIEKGTALTSWAEDFFDNQTGDISLTAGLPTPGLKTEEGTDPLMAKIIFKGKKVGPTDITVTSASKIYSNSDNQNILTSLLSSQVAITN